VASFSEIYKYVTAPCLDPLHQISLNLDNEYGKYACKLIYVIEYTAAFNAPITMKLTVMHYICIDLSCTKFYPHQERNIENMGRILFTPLCSLCQFL